MRAKLALSPKKRPSTSRGEHTYRVLGTATARLLEQRGYEALTTNHVARRAGVGVASVAAQLAAAAPSELRKSLEVYVGDATSHLPRGSTALAAFCAAMTVARLRGVDHFDDAGYREGRAWQSRFIATDLGLS